MLGLSGGRREFPGGMLEFPRNGKEFPLDVAAVIFDYAGVLSTPQPAPDRAELEALAGGPALWPVYWALREPYDLGQVTAERYWRQVGDRLGLVLDTDLVDRLTAVDAASWAHPNPPVVAWASTLAAAGVRTGLISNIPHELAANIRQLAWLPELAWTTFSCDLGAVKPDPVIFRHCLDGLGVRPEAAVFIDDTAANVTGAGALGLRAFHYTGTEALAADLDGLDGMPPLQQR